MKKKIILSTLVILVVVAASLGATFAWFTDQSEPIENVFVAGTVDINAAETAFVTDGFSAINWNPGDCADKKYTITNVGTKSIKLRAIVTTQWYKWGGTGAPIAYDPAFLPNVKKLHPGWVVWNPLAPLPEGGGYTVNAAKLTFIGTGWTETPANSGIWIYDLPIAGTFNASNPSSPNEPVGVNLDLKVCLDGPLAGNHYQGKAFTVNVTYQAIQASHAGEWNWDNVDFETGLVKPAPAPASVE